MLKSIVIYGNNMLFLLTILFSITVHSTMATARSDGLRSRSAGQLRQLLQQNPWDKQQIALILKHELSTFSKSDEGMPNAFDLFGQLVVEIPRTHKISQLLLWRMTTPHGQQHWLLGIRHDFKLQDMSTHAQQQLDTLLANIDTLMHEGGASLNTSLAIDAYSKFDQQLIASAAQRGKKIIPLESWQAIQRMRRATKQHVSALEIAAKIPMEMDNITIDAMLTQVIDSHEHIFKTIQAYVAGNPVMLQELSRARSKELLEHEHIILNKRNHNWLKKITARCKRRETCLIAAGNAHMLVDNDSTTSLITLLHQRGYQVEFSE